MTLLDRARPPAPLALAIVAEAVRRLDSDVPLDDAAALRQAFSAWTTRAAQVQERAWLLGQRLGLTHELTHWRRLAGWAVLVLALLMALAALAGARAVLSSSGDINAVAAFVTLLGWHVIMLLLWLAGLAWAGQGRAGGALLGQLALWLAARAPVDRAAHALPLLRAAAAVLQRERLWPWLTGLLSHVIWALAFVLVLAVLAFGFAFHAYRLTWETTILSVEFFQRFVAVTGALPSLLGFAVPDAAAVQLAGSAATTGGGQRDWAWWLMGCVAVYGLLPRALLAAFSAWRWQAGRARLARVDMTDPYVRRVVARLDALEPPPRVLDPAPKLGDRPSWTAATTAAPGMWALIGFELPPELPWPPAGLPAPSIPALFIDGSTGQRQHALAQLTAQRPAALLLVCHALASPDRGTARFMREAAALAGHTALLLLIAGGEAPVAAVRRWRDWLDAEGFEQLALWAQARPAGDWIVSEK
ncbi:MAG: DUF2868 domain-containing protein [Burkholderiaceae bacterium]|jgi:hypothetical protein|nr:DUF2868 domain-containing protein [Burkholderiaceae bacterium]